MVTALPTSFSTHGADLAQLVTFSIVNFNGEQQLPQTLDALRALHGGCRVVVIDDGSTDESRALTKKDFPQVDLIELGPNNGRIGRARKRAVNECRTPYLMLLDNDITFARDCVARLLAQLRAHPRAMSFRPRLVYRDRPTVIYQDANTLHYLALAADQHRDSPVDQWLTPAPRDTLGGGIMLLNCAIVHAVGNFDENYLFGWGDDLELDVRARLYGYVTLHDPYAIGYHSERTPDARRVAGQLYNRRRLILTCYSGRSLVTLAPALLLFELILLLMCVAGGWYREYWRAFVLLKADRQQIAERRRQLQASRIHRSDDVVLSDGSISITGRMSTSRFLVALAPVLSAASAIYWRLSSRLARLGVRDDA